MNRTRDPRRDVEWTRRKDELKKGSRVHDEPPRIVRAPPAAGDQPENWRATNPSTGRPPYFLIWSGSFCRFTAFVVGLSEGVYASGGTPLAS